MPLDAIFLGALKDELLQKTAGMRIDKVTQPTADVIVFALRGGNSCKLIASSGAGNARVHLTNSAYENPQTPPMFCMLLRKHITGAKILNITQPPGERLLDFVLGSTNQLGDECEKHLIVEMMGRYANIILTDEDGIITDCRKRVDASDSEKRQVMPGLKYRLPPRDERPDPFCVPREEIESKLREKADAKVSEAILSSFFGLAPLICREIAWRAYGAVEVTVAEALAVDGMQKLLDEFSAIMETAKQGDFSPCVLVDGTGKPMDYSFIPILQYGDKMELEIEESFSELLDSFYTETAKASHVKSNASEMLKTIKRAQDRITKKLAIQKQELETTHGRDRLRELGDILTANFHLVKKGMQSFSAQDFYSESGEMCEIKLDSLKTPQQNAAKYYKDYNRAKTAERYLTEQIRLGEEETGYLASVMEEIQRAAAVSELAEIKEELTQTGYLRKRQTSGKIKKPVSEPLNFISSEGFRIRVGKNNIQNDRLTMKEAFKTDIWLHVQKLPGSHVIISTEGKTPDEATILEAASLAAYYSEGKNSGKVAVDYCLVKNVKKPPGAKPGRVIYSDFKTVLAQPSAETAERLSAVAKKR